jgi:hypothetical protein
VYADGDAVTLVYRARSGRPILFLQVPGSAEPYVQKFVTAATRRVRIGDDRGLLLRGRHVVVFERPGGGTGVQESRLASDALLWERGGLLLRIEAAQPPGELLRIARSVR